MPLKGVIAYSLSLTMHCHHLPTPSASFSLMASPSRISGQVDITMHTRLLEHSNHPKVDMLLVSSFAFLYSLPLSRRSAPTCNLDTPPIRPSTVYRIQTSRPLHFVDSQSYRASAIKFGSVPFITRIPCMSHLRGARTSISHAIRSQHFFQTLYF